MCSFCRQLTQSSCTWPVTRKNSRVLLVTWMAPAMMALPVIGVSFGPVARRASTLRHRHFWSGSIAQPFQFPERVRAVWIFQQHQRFAHHVLLSLSVMPLVTLWFQGQRRLLSFRFPQASQPLTAVTTDEVDIPYRSCHVGNAPAARNSSGNPICRKTGIICVCINADATASPNPPTMLWFSVTTTRSPLRRYCSRISAVSRGLMVGTCRTERHHRCYSGPVLLLSQAPASS